MASRGVVGCNSAVVKRRCHNGERIATTEYYSVLPRKISWQLRTDQGISHSELAPSTRYTPEAVSMATQGSQEVTRLRQCSMWQL